MKKAHAHLSSKASKDSFNFLSLVKLELSGEQAANGHITLFQEVIKSACLYERFDSNRC